MKITLDWLKEKGACAEGVAWFKAQKKSEAVDVLNALIKDDQLEWANWTIVRVMTRPQYLAYAIYAAEQVIHIWKEKYPDDDRPQKAIQAAKDVLKDDTPESRSEAAGAAEAAWAARAAGADGYLAMLAAAQDECERLTGHVPAPTDLARLDRLCTLVGTK